MSTPEGILTLMYLVGLTWSKDPDSYAGSSVATGRTTRARQVKGYDPDKNGYPGPPGLGLYVGLQPHPIKMFC